MKPLCSEIPFLTNIALKTKIKLKLAFLVNIVSLISL